MTSRPSLNSPTGYEGRDRPQKKAKTTDTITSRTPRVILLLRGRFIDSFLMRPITEDPDSVAHLVRHFKPAGSLLPSLRNMTERDAYLKMGVAHAKVRLFALMSFFR